MDEALFKRLHSEGMISDGSLDTIQAVARQPVMSLHVEIKTLLYLGVLLFAGGLGILIYKNIDTIGHTAIVAFISLVCAGSFYYCVQKKHPFSKDKVKETNTWLDYLLLLACSTFITLIAYIQFQYGVFGTRYGLALFIPMIVLFFSAYYFDHIGILTMAITNLGAWVGITVTPLDYLRNNEFDNPTIIFTALALGLLLLLVGWSSKHQSFKAHFEFTYNNFGTHLVLIAILSLMFHFSSWAFLGFLLLALACWYFHRRAMADRSFYFLLVIAVYAYIGAGYMMILLLEKIRDVGALYLGLIYFIGSAVGFVSFLINANKKVKSL